MERAPQTRRQVLRWGLGAGGLLLFDPLSRALRPAAAATQGGGGYQLLDVIPFVDEGRNFVGFAAGEGRDGRKALDLTRLTSKSLVTPIEKFFVRTSAPQSLPPAETWQVSVEGLVDHPRTLGLAELEAMAVPLGAQLNECAGSTRNSGFGLMSAAEWHGVPLGEILAGVAPRPEGARVLISGLDPETGPFPGGNWIFTLEQLLGAGGALATRMNGMALPAVHGRPVRLVMPGWFGCCWVKWVNRIVFVPDEVAATSQMREFAGRTHQQGIPRLAREYTPAVIDPAAMPVRVEMWSRDEELFYRVVGVAWGGPIPPRPVIRFGPGAPFLQVESFTPPPTATWTLWSHIWRPRATGRHAIELRFEDRDLRTRRMDSGFYQRSVDIPALS